jgi:hypothetical protein
LVDGFSIAIGEFQRNIATIGSKELLGARNIQKKAARYAYELLSELPPETLGTVSITKGTDFDAAIQKNVRDLKIAIAKSSWPRAAKEAAISRFPAGLTGGGGGSGNWSGGNVHWRLLLLLDAHHYLFQRPVVCDSIHSEDMLYADANTGAYAAANTRSNSQSIGDTHRDSDSYRYAYSDYDANNYSYSNTAGDSYTHTDARSNSNTYSHPNSNIDSYSNADTYAYAMSVRQAGYRL